MAIHININHEGILGDKHLRITWNAKFTKVDHMQKKVGLQYK